MNLCKVVAMFTWSAHEPILIKWAEMAPELFQSLILVLIGLLLYNLQNYVASSNIAFAD